MKNKKTRKIFYGCALGFFIAVFLGSAIYLGRYAWQSHNVKSSFNELSALKEQVLSTQPSANTINGGSVSTDSTDPSGDDSQLATEAEVDPDATDENGMLLDMAAVYALNSDVVGWITIPGTNIDYPVMQTKNYTDYYLRRSFEKTYSTWGCIYAREKCDVFAPSDNVVLYGHHMGDGTMFAQLDYYKTKSYWQENQTFTFDTLYERHTYRIFAVFKTSGTYGEGFPYYSYNDFSSQASFDSFIANVLAMAFYDTGIVPQYGDHLLTLSTCEYTLTNGRFVVMAVQND